VAADKAASEVSAQERCTKQSALNAARNAKYLSSQQKANLSFAGNVTRKEKHFNLDRLTAFIGWFLFFFFLSFHFLKF